MAIGLVEASLFCIVLESILFGVFNVLIAAALYVVVYKRRKAQPVNKTILAVAILMYIVAFAHIVVVMRRSVIGFVRKTDEAGGAFEYFFRTSDPSYLLENALYFVQTVIGDSFVVYRLYIVWGKDYRVLYPALLCLAGCIACGIGALLSVAHASATTSVFESEPFITALFVMTLFTNLTCTMLIAAKIWWVGRKTASILHTRTLIPIAIVIVESGALYSASLLILLIAFLRQSWAKPIMVDLVVQIIGIAFSLIIVRVGLGLTSEDTTLHTGRSSATPPGFNGHHLQDLRSAQVAVHVSRERKVRDDCGYSMDSPGASSSFTDVEYTSDTKISSLNTDVIV